MRVRRSNPFFLGRLPTPTLNLISKHILLKGEVSVPICVENQAESLLDVTLSEQTGTEDGRRGDARFRFGMRDSVGVSGGISSDKENGKKFILLTRVVRSTLINVCSVSLELFYYFLFSSHNREILGVKMERKAEKRPYCY